jgi:(R,R)-butanediol dehydrogenase/meso-butanediol dehydrogenase/diacetyl reductase
LKTLFSGICFSDKHGYEGTPFLQPGRGVGHEYSGEVVELGPNVQGLKMGDIVAVDPVATCLTCLMCQAGMRWKCTGAREGLFARPGGDAELIAAKAFYCYPVPSTVTALQAAYVEPMTVGTRAVRNSGVAIGDNVVILGGEDYTMSVLQWVRHFAGQAVLVDPSPARQEMARRLGATEVVDPTQVDPVARVKELMPFGADYVFVSMEGYVPRSHEYLKEALVMARIGGNVVVQRQQGMADPAVPVATTGPNSVHSKELTVRGFGAYFGEEPWRGGRARGDYQVTIDGMASGQICGADWRPTVIPFSSIKSKADVDAAFQSLPNANAKILFKMSGD